MPRLNHILSSVLTLAALLSAPARVIAEAAPALPLPKVNKLQFMYNFYYLPFTVEFREGRTANDILPYIPDGNDGFRMIRAEELQKLDDEWAQLKEPWKKKSLLLTTQVTLNQTSRLTNRIVTHRVAITRSALENLPLEERMQLLELLKSKPKEVQAAFRQLVFLKSFLGPADQGKLNFFVVSASWCESCREYRMLLESYMKAFPEADFNLHSVVIEDPKEEIFDRPILKDLFPHSNKYSHESIPRFLSLDWQDQKMTVLEEGEALQDLYERYFREHRGFMDSKTTLFKKLLPPKNPLRSLSSTVR